MAACDGAVPHGLRRSPRRHRSAAARPQPPPPAVRGRDASRRDGASGPDRDLSANAGGDLKWAVTSNSVLDLAVNPDFGQIDVDRQVVNLTRFSVFFPERRQFFPENRGVFFTGTGARFEPFFSRRIGLDEAGEPIPIRAGARLTARSADHAFGALAVSQGGDGTDAEFGVLRYVRNFREGATIAKSDDLRHGRILEAPRRSTTLVIEGGAPLINATSVSQCH